MVMLGIASDRRTIHVRTDDLSPRERGQVHECADLISQFKIWKAQGGLAGIFTFLGIMLVVCIGICIAVVSGTKVDADGIFTSFMFGIYAATILGLAACLIAGGVAIRDTEKGIQTLYTNMQSSPRCDEFVQEYAEDSTLLRQLLNCYPKPAKCST